MPNCFLIMPFRPELNYLYRIIKQHVEHSFPGVSVARGDDRALTRPILEKIADYIKQADVLVADCSGRNPNVFYELGLAHALDKPVVLITGDPVEDMPTDIKAFEFISYGSLDPDKFLARLETALQSVIGDPYAEIYPEAVALFAEFCHEAHLDLVPLSQDDFVASSRALRETGQHLATAKGRTRTELLVRRLLGVDADIKILVALKDWLEAKYPP